MSRNLLSLGFTVGTAVLVLLAPRARGAEVDAERFRPAIDQYARLGRAEQARWLEDLFANRSEPACRTYMSTKSIEHQVQRHQAILNRVQAGKELSDAGLKKILSEIDQQEAVAIECLVREFLYTTYRAFPNGEAEFDRRVEAWRQLRKRWDSVGRPWRDQSQLVHWLRTAIAQEKVAPRSPLPALPQWAAPVKASDSTRAAVAAAARPGQNLAPTAQRSGVTQASATSPAANFDRSELSARIAGYNLASADLMARLQVRRELGFAELEPIVDTLSELVLLRSDLMLYWNLVPADARASMKPIDRIEAAIALVGARTSAARKRLEHAGAAAEAGAARVELLRLDELSRRLAELARN